MRAQGRRVRNRMRTSRTPGCFGVVPLISSFRIRWKRRSPVEPASCVRQHGVDLASLRAEIAARDHLPAVIARDVVQEPLELGDIAVDRLHELAIGAIPPANILDRALALHGAEHMREYISLAAFVAVPKLGGSCVIDHASNIDRDGIEGLDGVTLTSYRIRRRLPSRCFA